MTDLVQILQGLIDANDLSAGIYHPSLRERYGAALPAPRVFLEGLNQEKALREYRSVRCLAGRASGHTSAIVKIVDEDDLVVARRSLLHDIARRASDIQGTKKFRMVGIDELGKDHLMGLRFRRIFVDVASEMGAADIDKIYQFALQSRANQVIMVG